MLRLLPHDDSAVHSVDAFHVRVNVDHTGLLWLRYHVDTDPALVTLPPLQERAARADNLWKATCFECFVRCEGKDNYLELNFSPARKYAAYHFEDYRKGMRIQRLSAMPEIFLDESASHIALEATLPLPSHFVGQPLDMGLTAIIAEREGTKSYWSLAHPPGKPNFHHSTCFALKLPPPVAP